MTSEDFIIRPHGTMDRHICKYCQKAQGRAWGHYDDHTEDCPVGALVTAEKALQALKDAEPKPPIWRSTEGIPHPTGQGLYLIEMYGGYRTMYNNTYATWEQDGAEWKRLGVTHFMEVPKRCP